jgi:hypothetical protein
MHRQPAERQVRWGFCLSVGTFFLFNRQVSLLFHDNSATYHQSVEIRLLFSSLQAKPRLANYRSVSRNFAMTCEWQ